LSALKVAWLGASDPAREAFLAWIGETSTGPTDPQPDDQEVRTSSDFIDMEERIFAGVSSSRS
jgi:hypothetical protein